MHKVRFFKRQRCNYYIYRKISWLNLYSLFRVIYFFCTIPMNITPKALNKLYCIIFDDDWIQDISDKVYDQLISKLNNTNKYIVLDNQVINIRYLKRIMPRNQISEIDHFIWTQSKTIRQKLLDIKALRSKQFPYKKPFESIRQIQNIINDINS